MLSKKTLWGSLASLVLLTSTSAVVLAEMPASPSKQTIQPLEQPLALKLGVTIGGLALIGLELWWFILSKSSTHQGIPKLRKK